LKRGEVWWARLPAPARERPVVLLSRHAAYTVRRSVTVAPITTKVRNIPVEVPVGVDEGLPRPSVVNTDDVATIPAHSLGRRVGQLSSEKMQQVEDALGVALSLPEFKR